MSSTLCATEPIFCREAPTTLRESFHSADYLLRCRQGLTAMVPGVA